MRANLITRLLLLSPERVHALLATAQARGLIAQAPNVWQITLGVARMLHRMVTRPESIGLSLERPPRAGWRARLFQARPLRLPFVLAIGAVRPWDLSGMLSRPDELIRHLVGTHHDRVQFAYDIQILSLTPGGLERLLAAAQAARAGASARARLMQDLCVFEGYHDNLVFAAERALAGDFLLSDDEARDPDISFAAYLRWCQAQPPTLAATLAALRDGRFALGHGEPFGVRA